MIFEEPGGVAAELPFCAGVGTGAEDYVEAFALGFSDEFGDIVLAGEVVDAGAGLVEVPKDVGGDGVEAHGFGHAEAGAPVGTGNAGIVHFAGDDAEGLSVEEEVAAFRAEGVGRGSWRRLRGCGQGDEAEDEGGKELEGVGHGMKVAVGEAGRDSFRKNARQDGQTLRDALMISEQGDWWGWERVDLAFGWGLMPDPVVVEDHSFRVVGEIG